MSRSPVISTLLIFALFIASTVMSAPREDMIPQLWTEGEIHKTREAEILKEPSRSLRNERFDISREDELLHRLTRVAKEPLINENNTKEKVKTNESLIIKNTNDNSTLSMDKSEIKDMNESHVTPKDDDDDPKDGKGEDLVPDIFPADNKTVDIRQGSREALEKLKYTIDEGKTNIDADKTETTTESIVVVPVSSTSNIPTKEQKHIGDSTTTAPATAAASTTIAVPITETTSVVPTTTTVAKTASTAVASSSTKNERITDNPTTTTDRPTSSSPSPEEQKLHEKKKPVREPMPAGVIALMIAISFAIVAIVAYIGLLVRRRYFEWRYGNRELLVNDFDAADISNFEL